MPPRHWASAGVIGALLSLAAAGLPLPARSQMQDGQDLITLLEQGSCARCRLQDADLVHANLRDAQLPGAQLQRSNLSRARLDGADLRGANLSFASLLGASLRGADLRGAQLNGADLRQADLTGTQLDSDALASSHWEGAVGVTAAASSYAAMHNAGVAAAQQGRLVEAEDYFSRALTNKPDAAITWLARGITRSQQAQHEQAEQDISYAAALYEQQGDGTTATALKQQLEKTKAQRARQNGNGMGSGLLQAASGLFQQLAPLAIKVFAPMAF